MPTGTTFWHHFARFYGCQLNTFLCHWINMKVSSHFGLVALPDVFIILWFNCPGFLYNRVIGGCCGSPRFIQSQSHVFTSLSEATLPETGRRIRKLLNTRSPKFFKTVDDFNFQPPRPYNFDYAVKYEPTYNDYSHEQRSDGKVTTGSYRVLLPDGRTQIVTYKADENGYVADVKYEGEAKYPEYKPSYQPAAYPKST